MSGGEEVRCNVIIFGDDQTIKLVLGGIWYNGAF